MSFQERLKAWMETEERREMEPVDLDERLASLASDTNVVALATELVDGMVPDSSSGLYFALKNYAVACIGFLYDWGNPEDLNADGLVRLASMGLRGGDDPDCRVPLDELFDELQNGYRIVPAALESECKEILTYHKQGLLTDKQMEAFATLPSQEAYTKTKALAEENKRAVEQAMPNADLPWKTAGVAEGDETGDADADCADTSERRRGLKQKTTYVRNSDCYAPGFMQKADGSFGIDFFDDLACRSYHIYKAFRPELVQTAAAMFATAVSL